MKDDQAVHNDPKYWNYRACLREPIPEIFEAAQLLREAADHSLSGQNKLAELAIKAADMPVLSEWVESLWGPGKESSAYHRIRTVPGLPAIIPKQDRAPRMHGKKVKQALIDRDGYFCRYCGIPVIRAKIRKLFQQKYPEAARWGSKNTTQHSGFQCLWLTYEHLWPHSRGGQNDLDNMIISCQACNCGKFEKTLDELGLFNPLNEDFTRKQDSVWNGLEDFKQS
ncbi:MAG: hypothetical protein Alpg2KO_17190 [Alphaproteobacteria bacterium]